MRVVRNFCLYRRRYEAASFLPDSRLFPPRHQVVRPHLFTRPEVVRLLDAISALPAAPTSPFRRENLRLAIVLLYTTGLRLGELVRLTLGDYDSREHTLLIRDSKFHKSRLVPLSIDGTREVDGYLAVRRTRQIAISPESPSSGTTLDVEPPTPAQASQTRSGLSCAPLKIRTETGRMPRVHDFRHTFAHRRHCCDGTAEVPNVQAKLPCWRHTWATSRSSRRNTT